MFPVYVCVWEGKGRCVLVCIHEDSLKVTVDPFVVLSVASHSTGFMHAVGRREPQTQILVEVRVYIWMLESRWGSGGV